MVVIYINVGASGDKLIWSLHFFGWVLVRAVIPAWTFET